ncbi:hypothetical protein DHEL01_v212015 [Diaporthe helianthi]|uniref:Peptidase S8/S53 domain-containing protein n=1 Tax=Diaporthe helianthi TaxID=158607 RepID=A0A2P5HH66_DIAHE|nr:hypothetical protein DHEL01_v212015 [Diaporthe helianthi]
MRKLNGISPGQGSTTTKASDRSYDELEVGADNSSRCLHNEVDVMKVLGGDRKLKDVLKHTLDSEENARACLQSLMSAMKFDKKQNNPHLIKLESFKTIVKLCHRDVFEEASASDYNPLQQAVRLLDQEALNFELLYNVIQTLVERCPAAIFFKPSINGTTTTIFRLLKELKQSNKAPNKDWIQRTGELLKERCIGYRTERVDPKTNEVKLYDMWAEKRDLMYWDAKSGQSFPSTHVKYEMRLQYADMGTEKQFCLNLVGETQVLDEVYIEKIKDQAGMRFESVLDFVKLPYWKPDKTDLAQPKREAPGNSGAAESSEIKPNPYISIFDWLYTECGVKKIFTVDVIDDGSEPHSNAAIRRCLRGADSEGKQLRDFKVEVWKWKKFDVCSDTVFYAAPAAREVHLYSHGNTANSDDEQDCRNLENQFKKNVVKHCKKLQEKEIQYRIQGVGSRKKDNENAAGMRSLVTTSSQVANKQKMAKLYIARLDDSPESRTRENQNFTIASCVKALKWAIAMEVDIISMSWTYERSQTTVDTDKKEFEQLIHTIAKENKAILFGSLPDMGPNTELHRFVPVGMDGVIKISSATLSGAVSAENTHTKSNFILPGEGYESLTTGEKLRGSSFATAYAAGLAAMVLYTLKAYHSMLKDDQDAEDAEKALAIGSKGDGMRMIFRILAQKGPEDNNETGLFVRPFLTFGDSFMSNTEGQKLSLRKVVADIVPTSVKRAAYDTVLSP